mmetsp:Transcript_100052/g.172683  ORF Transcript_100052/g.172683 Transcript_100052/m.172683 type:complete len:353 (-) Transcript_100052:55-1113(-)
MIMMLAVGMGNCHPPWQHQCGSCCSALGRGFISRRVRLFCTLFSWGISWGLRCWLLSPFGCFVSWCLLSWCLLGHLLGCWLLCSLLCLCSIIFSCSCPCFGSGLLLLNADTDGPLLIPRHKGSEGLHYGPTANPALQRLGLQDAVLVDAERPLQRLALGIVQGDRQLADGVQGLQEFVIRRLAIAGVEVLPPRLQQLWIGDVLIGRSLYRSHILHYVADLRSIDAVAGLNEFSSRVEHEQGLGLAILLLQIRPPGLRVGLLVHLLHLGVLLPCWRLGHSAIFLLLVELRQDALSIDGIEFQLCSLIGVEKETSECWCNCLARPPLGAKYLNYDVPILPGRLLQRFLPMHGRG